MIHFVSSSVIRSGVILLEIFIDRMLISGPSRKRIFKFWLAMDVQVIFSAKLLRKHVHFDEGDVSVTSFYLCCENLRGFIYLFLFLYSINCERLYLML